jgi:murein DD-endopeptidase MepM/ murein hydrolase activator NlpD
MEESSPAHVGSLSNSIDFAVPTGTRIYAAADGIVVRIKDDSNMRGTSLKYWALGNYIDIKHANGEFTWYEHLKFKGVLVKAGERVKKGQVIGYSGNTGFTTGPHLHFQVNRYFGKGDDDYVTLKARFSDFENVYKNKRKK